MTRGKVTAHLYTTVNVVTFKITDSIYMRSILLNFLHHQQLKPSHLSYSNYFSEIDLMYIPKEIILLDLPKQS